ncbi:histidine ammonia-lyase [Allostreptomyces psammosilenae]|uniref:Histidine ammonia-lyase n=1 Tax=Allostreptomyces psammosilenae TaxID=1892865 RepID=A0A852ZLC6_9ACTN|nr:histidine ammonia-lyase [Allostreptomyces psammosilenae]NYI03186.1 histidine ammonia-lyase [Allostreptomyces psammosilenae]
MTTHRAAGSAADDARGAARDGADPRRPVVLGPGGVTAGDVLAVARGGAPVELSGDALARMSATRVRIEALAAEPRPVYGVSTGFGALAVRHISPELRVQLQRSLIRSHAAGMGPAVETEVVRALLFLRLRTLASGRTGVRPVLAETMAAMLNAGITPVVREYGSLGCSGDLAPLAHCALALTGEGEATGPDGTVRPASELLAEAGIAPVELREKEGLALINGTDGMLGMLVLACADLARLLTTADIAAAMSLQALLGTDRVLHPALQALRPHPGQAESAANMRALLAGSTLTGHHQSGFAGYPGEPRVQDAYSLRCAPQVAGAVRDTLAHARAVADRELASAVDNPVVLPDGRVESNGNFHGAPVGYALDFLAIAVADLGSIAERRTDRLLDAHRSHGLPPFLAEDPGVDSGLMIAQYTQAALVSELKRLAAPASVDSIPSSAMQEDHVSMGWSAARKLRTALDHLGRILAVELVAAARGTELRLAALATAGRDGALADNLAPGTAAALAALRGAGVHGPGPDRYLAPDLAAAESLVASGRLVEVVRAVVGPLA